MRIVCISDTHGHHRKFTIPPGDVLIHAGDFTNIGEIGLIHDFNVWLGCQPHKYKIVVAGNHEVRWSKEKANLLTNAIYLEDSGTNIDGVSFYGSPWQPAFNNWAFNLPRGEQLREKWAMIPENTDVLITHGPPQGIFDTTYTGGEHLGCYDLWQRVSVIRPKLHVFGHIHGSHGLRTWRGTTFGNAALLNEAYQVCERQPLVLDIAID
jgi:Icc-related predicted phosphoesterase